MSEVAVRTIDLPCGGLNCCCCVGGLNCCGVGGLNCCGVGGLNCCVGNLNCCGELCCCAGKCGVWATPAARHAYNKPILHFITIYGIEKFLNYLHHYLEIYWMNNAFSMV